MEFKVQGVIDSMGEAVTGESKAGKSWTKQTYTIKTDHEYNNLYAFEVFGDEKVEKLNKFNKVGDSVEVSFNIKTNEYNGKYYTSLQSWRIDKSAASAPVAAGEEGDSLPF